MLGNGTRHRVPSRAARNSGSAADTASTGIGSRRSTLRGPANTIFAVGHRQIVGEDGRTGGRDRGHQRALPGGAWAENHEGAAGGHEGPGVEDLAARPSVESDGNRSQIGMGEEVPGQRRTVERRSSGRPIELHTSTVRQRPNAAPHVHHVFGWCGVGGPEHHDGDQPGAATVGRRRQFVDVLESQLVESEHPHPVHRPTLRQPASVGVEVSHQRRR